MVWHRLPVGLALLQDPIGRFGQVSSHGPHGDSVALPLAGTLKEGDDVLLAPAGVVLLADDDVGGFDVPPLRYGMLRERPT